VSGVVIPDNPDRHLGRVSGSEDESNRRRDLCTAPPPGPGATRRCPPGDAERRAI
jgi:hypothetical protein